MFLKKSNISIVIQAEIFNENKWKRGTTQTFNSIDSIPMTFNSIDSISMTFNSIDSMPMTFNRSKLFSEHNLINKNDKSFSDQAPSAATVSCLVPSTTEKCEENTKVGLR